MLHSRLALSLSLLCLFGCQETKSIVDPRAQSLETIKLELGGKPFTIEVADQETERAIGLMFRDVMPGDHGMIFVFKEEDFRGFWMKNTRIPLDIAYLDKDGKIVSVHQMKPFDLRETDSDDVAMYAIELNAGAAAPAGLKAGVVVKLPTLVAKD